MIVDQFQGYYHLAMVTRRVETDDCDPYYALIGLVTLEDIVEEILQAEIVDETDVIIDNVHRTRRRDVQARDITRILENDCLDAKISVQMQIVAIQWLTSNQPAFHNDLISQTVLERLIRQNVRLIESPHLPDNDDMTMTTPRTARIYTNGEACDRFVLILEGRVMVTIGKVQINCSTIVDVL